MWCVCGVFFCPDPLQIKCCSDDRIILEGLVNLGMASGTPTMQGEMLYVMVLKRLGNALRQ